MRVHQLGLPVITWAAISLAFWTGTGLGQSNHWRSPFSHRIHQYQRLSVTDTNASLAPPADGSYLLELPNLHARANDGRFTFYKTGLGACGKYNKPHDFIVALNVEQWEGGKHCFEMITIKHQGKKIKAQIVDLCPSCPWGALDFSEGLFDYFASQAIGVLYGQWQFGTEEKSAKVDKHKSKPEKHKADPKPKAKQGPTSKPKAHEVHDEADIDITTIAGSLTEASGTEPVQLPFPTALPGLGTVLEPPSVGTNDESPQASATPQTGTLEEVNMAIINLAALSRTFEDIANEGNETGHVKSPTAI